LIPPKKPPEESNKKGVLKKFLNSIREFVSCDSIKTFLPLHNKAVYPVSTIEGMQSATKLLEMYLKMKSRYHSKTMRSLALFLRYYWEA
jgi:hypothetical protein